MFNIEALEFISRGRPLKEKRIMLLMDNPLKLEMKSKVPFSGAGVSSVLAELTRYGANRHQIHLSYLFDFYPTGGDLSGLFWCKGLDLTDYSPFGKDMIMKFASKQLEQFRQEELHKVNPDLILACGKWGLYFLTGETSYKETASSTWGSLLKYRASTLELSEFWSYQKPHIVMPLLTLQAKFSMPQMALPIKQDYLRAGVVAKAVLQDRLEEYTLEGRNYNHQVATYATAREFLLTQLAQVTREPTYYSVDVETVSGYHDCVGIATSATTALCIGWSTKDNPCLFSEAEEVTLQHLLRALFHHPNFKHIGQNYSYDIQYFWRDLGVDVLPTDDTMVMQHTMFAGLKKNLAFLSSLYAKVYKHWKDERKTQGTERFLYNCKDCCYTYEVWESLTNLLRRRARPTQLAYKFQITEVLPCLRNMMRTGLRIDRTQMLTHYRRLDNLVTDIDGQIDTIVGEPINPASPKQVAELLYDLFQLPKQRDPKTKRLTVGTPALQYLYETEILSRPIITRLLERSKLAKARSVLKAVPDPDGRMRTQYGITGTDTFRFNSTLNAFNCGMAMQNLTKGGKTPLGQELPNCRQIFVPDEGYTFFDIDLDSADLRIVTALSGASDLQKMFDEGLKPYVELMKEYYQDDSLTKKSPQYKTFKAFCHGTNYIGGANTLSALPGLCLREVKTLQNWYFRRNPEILNWHKELARKIKGTGQLSNVFGFHKYFFDLTLPNLMQIAAAWEPQSTVALLINKGMVAIDQEHEKGLNPVKVLLQTHDSIAGQYPTDQPECKDLIIRHCTISLPYSTPITIPVEIQTSETSWGHC